jgi:hypothetical protein
MTPLVTVVLFAVLAPVAAPGLTVVFGVVPLDVPLLTAGE